MDEASLNLHFPVAQASRAQAYLAAVHLDATSPEPGAEDYDLLALLGASAASGDLVALDLLTTVKPASSGLSLAEAVEAVLADIAKSYLETVGPALAVTAATARLRLAVHILNHLCDAPLVARAADLGDLAAELLKHHDAAAIGSSTAAELAELTSRAVDQAAELAATVAEIIRLRDIP